ncbi:27369_t:CDS:2, partial [Racocetra persica]
DHEVIQDNMWNRTYNFKVLEYNESESKKDVFKISIMKSFNPDLPFKKFSMSCEVFLNRDIEERKYIVQAEYIKDIKAIFPEFEFDFVINKTDGIRFKNRSHKEEAMFGLISILRNFLDKSTKLAK